MKNIVRIMPFVVLTLPSVAFAQFSGIKGMIQEAGTLVRMLISLLMAVALLVFFWGLVKFIRSVSESGKSEGKMFMVWGLIALFVMVSVWGIIAFLQRELNLPNSTQPALQPPLQSTPVTPIFNTPGTPSQNQPGVFFGN